MFCNIETEQTYRPKNDENEYWEEDDFRMMEERKSYKVLALCMFL